MPAIQGTLFINECTMFGNEGQSMTELLEKALAKVSKLSSEEQDVIGALILDVPEDERPWKLAFAGSKDKLAKLAEKARGEIHAG